MVTLFVVGGVRRSCARARLRRDLDEARFVAEDMSTLTSILFLCSALLVTRQTAAADLDLSLESAERKEKADVQGVQVGLLAYNDTMNLAYCG